MKENYLFLEESLKMFFENRKSKLKEEIYNFGEDYILKVSEEDLIKSLVEKYTLVPPVLKMDEKHLLEPKEIDVRTYDDDQSGIQKGTLIVCVIPFEGDQELFHHVPSRCIAGLPQAEIDINGVHFHYATTSHDSESIQTRINKDIQDISFYLTWVRNDVDNFNSSLESYVRGLIKTRKDKLLKDRNLVSALDIPIKKRGNSSWTYSIPVTPKKIKIELPKVKPGKFKPEPTLAMEIYEDILTIIQNMATVMERSPKAFARMGEENLRDHFLVQLNGQYAGQAMGEVFNYRGKTDILIRYKNTNAFIAECKFWKGKKNLLETVDQLLKYITWQDTKTAILSFNRGGNLSEILRKIPEIVNKHSCYKRKLEISGETRSRYKLHHPDDLNREFLLTIMAFNIPKA